MSVGLLDVNMLVALGWASHTHSRAAHDWLSKNHESGWATCPMTECAFVRLSSNSHIFLDAVMPSDAVQLLKDLTRIRGHVFWTETRPIADSPLTSNLIRGYKQVTDAYLLGLAMHHGGKLVTLDQKLAALVRESPKLSKHMEIVPVDGVL